MIFDHYLNSLGKRYAGAQILSSYTKDVISETSKNTFQVTDFSFENRMLSFYERSSSGFLSKQAIDIHEQLFPLHKSIVEQVGIIQECYNASSDFIRNLQEIFAVEKDEQIWEDIRIDIEEKVDESGKGANINAYLGKLSTLTIFAYETNGNCFMYDSEGLVYLYAPDHSYNDISPLSSWPDYTLYSVSRIKTFEDFIQLLFESLK